jgi:hypothetical protein
MNPSQNLDDNKLTAGEVSELFNAYLANSAAGCQLSYFLKKSGDPDIRAVAEFALNLSQKTVKQIAGIFKIVNHPTPKGFSEKDVNLNAQKLYTDNFMLTFIRFMARFELVNYCEARSSSMHIIVRHFFNETIIETMKLFDMADDLLLSKGLYAKEPSIPTPNRIDFIKKQSFLNGFFGDKRPLNANEINRLYLSFQRNSLGKAFLIGLSQGTKDKELLNYLIRGKELSEKHMEVMGSFLKKEDLPVPTSLDSEVTASTEQVFSDKLVAFLVGGSAGLGPEITGTSLSKVMRRDIALAFSRLMGEVALFAEDGMKLMIDREWFERIPEAIDREELIGV